MCKKEARHTAPILDAFRFGTPQEATAFFLCYIVSLTVIPEYESWGQVKPIFRKKLWPMVGRLPTARNEDTELQINLRQIYITSKSQALGGIGYWASSWRESVKKTKGKTSMVDCELEFRLCSCTATNQKMRSLRPLLPLLPSVNLLSDDLSVGGGWSCNKAHDVPPFSR